MKLQVVLTGAAGLALAAGTVQAKVHHHKIAARMGGSFAEPKQPVAYSRLDTYLRASPRARAKESWGLDNTGMAAGSATGAGANASASAPQNDTTQPSGAVAPADQGAAAPAPSTQAPNPPATAPSSAPQAAPSTSSPQ